ncbi:hypothetical protein E4K67_09065 [Desulfosporosinus fructosivorans]|uniref:DUF2178 domain-containing protein n=1 Tax=Desulfosporosinus fructosivorans TaxID=2018669 RepID=A0A4Z0R713_9FIRM|nr:hypothetical protein [Desulfosporosinus fructosivorans]TGE38119.1 hypothetical protein E4K67_09065 [Desulfosporosinus fructosivorans]
MKRKIYNKKKFWSGIGFLFLAAIAIPLDIIRFEELSTMRNIKHVLIDTFCILAGVTSVYRSLSNSCTKEDQQNDDEREKLVTLKSKSSAFSITFYICATIAALTLLAFTKTRQEEFMGIFIGIGIVPTIMIITEISCYFYHDKRT